MKVIIATSEIIPPTPPPTAAAIIAFICFCGGCRRGSKCCSSCSVESPGNFSPRNKNMMSSPTSHFRGAIWVCPVSGWGCHKWGCGEISPYPPMARFGRIRAIRSYAYGPFLYLVSYLISSYIYGFLFILTMILCFMESIKEIRMINGCRISKDRLFIYHKLSRVILLMPPEGLHTQLQLKISVLCRAW